MLIPIQLFLLIYAVLLILFLVFSFFNVFHALKFGLKSKVNEFTLGVYIVVSVLLIGGSLIYVQRIDWTQTIELFAVL